MTSGNRLLIRIVGTILLAQPLVFAGPDYVIFISVDGLGSSYLQSLDAAGKVPVFHRLMQEGASTLNARNDYDITVTLPNHTTMLTGRGVNGADGHNWTDNSDTIVGTIHSHKASLYPATPYVSSVLDVVHDNGKRTALYASKAKFSLFGTSYDATNGAADLIGLDNGRNKIDSFNAGTSSSAMNTAYIPLMTANPFHFSFLHYHNPDSDGHTYGWGSSNYNDAVIKVDGYIGAIMNMIDTTPALTGRTAVIVTADHGGSGTQHSDPTLLLDYQIPFVVWGAGVVAGDLYALNAGKRFDPGTARIPYTDSSQPIRNGDAANLALKMLNLGPVPGSTINLAQDLSVPEPAAPLFPLVALGLSVLRRRPRRA